MLIKKSEKTISSLMKEDARTECNQGFCGTCKCILIQGQVEYLKEPLAYLRSNEILPCISKPKTDIEILPLHFQFERNTS